MSETALLIGRCFSLCQHLRWVLSVCWIGRRRATHKRRHDGCHKSWKQFSSFAFPKKMSGSVPYRIVNERELILRRIGRELAGLTAYILREPLTDRMTELLAQLRGQRSGLVRGERD
jgi:hypothetical protein